ncbi:hypothetical protein TrRE_jg845 [Triparma retinervis]|uniref:Zn(2)-C6 fungal-type domain-containing protein n=1 Tax=Triparma retinervis TaxID=2557542 RepID=A0A9W6ZTR6_9STRA|nr:hypothetical protein TrRE_jg845 [Triparma retinervis]
MNCREAKVKCSKSLPCLRCVRKGEMCVEAPPHRSSSSSRKRSWEGGESFVFEEDWQAVSRGRKLGAKTWRNDKKFDEPIDTLSTVMEEFEGGGGLGENDTQNAGMKFLITDSLIRAFRFRNFHFLAIASNLANSLGVDMNEIMCAAEADGALKLEFVSGLLFQQDVTDIFRPKPARDLWPPEMSADFSLHRSLVVCTRLHQGTTSIWGSPRFSDSFVTDDAFRDNYIDCHERKANWETIIFPPMTLMELPDALGIMIKNTKRYGNDVQRGGHLEMMLSQKDGTQRLVMLEICMVIQSVTQKWSWFRFLPINKGEESAVTSSFSTALLCGLRGCSNCNESDMVLAGLSAAFWGPAEYKH